MSNGVVGQGLMDLLQLFKVIGGNIFAGQNRRAVGCTQGIEDIGIMVVQIRMEIPLLLLIVQKGPDIILAAFFVTIEKAFCR